MKTRTRSRSRAMTVVRASAPKPIVIRQTKVVKAKRRGGKLSRRGHGATLFSTDRMEKVGAAFALGVLEKLEFVKNLPTLPVVGKTGTVGLVAYFMSDGGRNKLADNVADAAFTVAGYMMGSTGSIVGGEDEGIGYVAGF